MEHVDQCQKTEACRPSGCKIVGYVLLAIATLLTLITLNGLAIFGMFLVGMLFCCHKHGFYRHGCC